LDAPCNALDLLPTSGIGRVDPARNDPLFSYRQPGLVAIDHADGWWTGYHHLTHVSEIMARRSRPGESLDSVAGLTADSELAEGST
jgi:hypothetical protein